VKEQTAGIYAGKLAGEGFVAIAFDASCQGKSSGEPRRSENPYARIENISAAVGYLTTLLYVDRGRIGVMGICAVMGDHRIKAGGAVSATNRRNPAQ
jgi:fermentation-respiration switch protein FrsA (DUF1100 family)